MYRLLATALIALTVLAHLPALASPYPEYRSIYVNDFAGLLSEDEATEIEEMLRSARAELGIEITVAIIESRQNFDPSDSLEAFATRMFNGWGIGDAQRNDGVMFLILTEDREMRLELGAGFVDAWNRQAEQIVQNIMVPNFRDGNMALGLKAGVATLTARARNNVMQGKAPTESPFNDGTIAEDFTPAEEDGGWLGWILGTLGVSGVGGGMWAIGRYLRYKPRDCANCGTRMGLLNETSDDAHLDSGNRLEEEINSVDYDVWECTSCAHVQITRWRNWFSAYGACRECQYRSLESDREVLRAATYSSSGRARIDYNCLHCGHAYSKTVTIPRKKKSKSGGSSFGGGRSSGGGASGSW